jgi:histidinol-phosphate aminotransferase
MTHLLARHVLQSLSLPAPYAQYREGRTERIYTNPYGGEHRAYPCPQPLALQARYAAWLEADLTRRGQRGRIPPDHVLFTAGSIAGIELLVRAFCEPGVDVLGIQSPTFPVFAHQARLQGVTVVDVPLGGSDFEILDAAAVCAVPAKLTFVCRPNNPAGSVHCWEDVVAVADGASGLVVVDEAYIEFCGLPSAVALLDRPNVVVLRTFSKAWGLAGTRAGAVIANPDVLDALRLIVDPFAFGAPAQAAVARVLDAPKAALAPLAAIRRQRERMTLELSKLDGVRVIPSETNFLLVLLDDPVQVPPSDRFVMPSVVPGALRVAIGTPDEDAAALSLIASLVRPLGHGASIASSAALEGRSA